MKITERKPAAKGEDFLTTVARSIGSTLGTVARKVKPSSRKSSRRRAKRKSPGKLGTASKNQPTRHRQRLEGDAAIPQRSSAGREKSPQSSLYRSWQSAPSCAFRG